MSGPGPIAAEQTDLLTEIVVFLALHRDGAYEREIGMILGPSATPAQVRPALLAARTWLGVDADGRPRLQPGPSGLWVLSADVRCDWELFVAYTHRAAHPDDASDRQSDLRDALGLIGGPMWSEVPDGRYQWVATTPVQRTMQDAVIDAAHQLATLTLERGDTVTAVAACRTGLRAVPTAEVLWRDLLRTVAARGDRRTLEAVAGELYRAIPAQPGRRNNGTEPETDALVQQLLPGFRRRRH